MTKRNALTLILTLALSAIAAAQSPAISPTERSSALAAGRAFGLEARTLDLETFGDRRFTGRSGVLVAEGDSWFDYPRADVLKMLQRQHDYTVESVAQYGHTLDSMAYDRNQLAGLAGQLKSLRDRGITPKAILISAGGNDIAGPELGVMLNNSRSGLGQLNSIIAGELVYRRFQVAMITLLSAVTELGKLNFDRRIPILIHGYDYPVPDGRGFLGGFWILPGPWLKPSFALKGDPLAPNSAAQHQIVLNGLIDDFNKMLEAIPKIDGLEHVRYVRLVGTLSSSPGNYTSDWGNELHPTPNGFKRVAEKFHEVIARLP